MRCSVAAPSAIRDRSLTPSHGNQHSRQDHLCIRKQPHRRSRIRTVPFGDNIGHLYIDGLAGEFGGPGPLKGYWTEPDVSHDDEDDNTLICPFAVIDDHGRTTRNWGQLVIAFTGDDFPTDFVLMRARCFEDPNEVITGSSYASQPPTSPPRLQPRLHRLRSLDRARGGGSPRSSPHRRPSRPR